MVDTRTSRDGVAGLWLNAGCRTRAGECYPAGVPEHTQHARTPELRWNEQVANWLASDEGKARMKAEGMEPGGDPPEQFQQVLSRDIGRWRKVMREAHIKPET